MNTKNRITRADDLRSIAVKLAEGNPGALNVIVKLITETEKIDPDAVMGPYTYLLSLDSHGIYGPGIWVLYKDTCGQDIIKTMAVLRACQIGFITDAQLAIVSNRDGSRGQTTINVDDVLSKVQERLPAFGKSSV